MKSYKDLEVYQASYKLAIEVHRITLTLPKHELYEIGSQVRRSSQSVKDNIIEGYGRRQYKTEFIRFLVFANASLLEAVSQLEMLRDLYQPKNIDLLIEQYNKLGKQLLTFINYVDSNWQTQKTHNSKPITDN